MIDEVPPVHSLGDILRRLDTLERKLDVVIERQLSTPQCPRPGLCLQIAESHAHHEKRVEEIEIRLAKLELWQNRILGGFSILLVILTLFGPAIRRAFHLE